METKTTNNRNPETEKSEWHRIKMYAYLTLLAIMLIVVLVNGLTRKQRNGVDVEDKIVAAMDAQLEEIFKTKADAEILNVGRYELVETDTPARQRLHLAETRLHLAEELASLYETTGEAYDSEELENARNEYLAAQSEAKSDKADKESNYFRSIRFKENGKTYCGYQKTDPKLKSFALVQVIEISTVSKDIEKELADNTAEQTEEDTENNNQ